MTDFEGAVEVATDLSCSEDHPTEPDVLVDIKNGNEWVRIPVTMCELFINKDGPADITRTAKVKFPAEWNGEDIQHYIGAFSVSADYTGAAPTAERADSNDQYDICRIWFKDEVDEVYEISHYGYVGGVGPAAENGVYKFWVYDVADLMTRIPISVSFDEPTIQQVLNFVLEGTDDQGRDVGIENRTPFDSIPTVIAGPEEVALRKEDLGNFGTNTGPYQTKTEDEIDDIWDATGLLVNDLLNGGKNNFKRNRNNLIDVMDWLVDHIGGKWHFEPAVDHVTLFYDNTGETNVETLENESDIARRRFVATEVDDDTGPFSDMATFDRVDQLDNDALYDIKPFNTLYLAGESSVPAEFGRTRKNPYDNLSGADYLSEYYPFVKVTYPPLLNRAGGNEYAPATVESSKTQLSAARREAVRQFREHLEETTEGSIEVKGTPYLLPYDYFTAVPVCNDIYANVDANPITYEVNSVKHRRVAGERYTTELGVSLVMDESEIEVTARMEEA